MECQRAEVVAGGEMVGGCCEGRGEEEVWRKGFLKFGMVAGEATTVGGGGLSGG